MSGARLARLIAAASCVIAIAAALITTRSVLSSWHDTSGAAPRAPRLAELSDQQLAELLPKQGEFPASWTISEANRPSDIFGYFRYHVSDDGLGFSPTECFTVFGVASSGAYDAAEVFGHDSAAPEGVSDPKDVQLRVAREFNPVGLDALIGVVSRCSQFTSASGSSYTLRVIEDSRPTGGPQRFRYSVTTSMGSESGLTQTDYLSFARQSGLILSGSANTAHQHVFDTLFDNTVRRISAR
jgi:hypothetical protein